MDRFDTAIVSTLQSDGRITWSQLATEVNLSASAVQRRVEALVERGVIENFTVNLNEDALGHAVKVFVTVHVERQDTGLAEDFRRRVREHPQVQACHMISGSADFMLEVVACIGSRFVRPVHRWRTARHAGRQGRYFIDRAEDRQAQENDDYVTFVAAFLFSAGCSMRINT
jgi:DNA-binding Lrp family transcriptional regulator